MIGRLGVLAGALVLVGGLAACQNGPKVGAEAPAFSAMDDRGAEASLAAYEGKVVVLDFWATWCAPCLTASPYVQDLHEQFAGNDGVVVLGVHYDGRGEPAAYMAEHGYTFPVILDGTGVVKAYGVTTIPTFLVIDRQGVVVYKQVGLWGPEDVEKLADVVEAHL